MIPEPGDTIVLENGEKHVVYSSWGIGGVKCVQGVELRVFATYKKVIPRKRFYPIHGDLVLTRCGKLGLVSRKSTTADSYRVTFNDGSFRQYIVDRGGMYYHSTTSDLDIVKVF